ncbi:MAG: CotH kinase family protein [Deltaproteobacteria bacterium]|nr:CotH kinase family protein [Deltaproteobacteria bacterium]
MRWTVGLVAFLVMACSGCGGSSSPPPADGDAGGDADADSDADADGDAGPAVDESVRLYEPERVIEVSIEMSDEDAEALRLQTRDPNSMLEGDDCLSEPFPSPFTYFPATVTVDGETVENVGVRKKGLLGSLSETKPSLKVDFGEYVADRELFGVEKLTLNNSLSDPSYVRQCLGYALFAEAGVPAPRCNFAHVVANGHDLGLYVNLESMGKDFLRRHFDDEDGNLYEGTLSDFRAQWVGSFDNKDADALDFGDLGEAVGALESPDGALLDALDPVFDVDQFLTYWAMEILTAHVDGYASNTNNFFVYHDPTSDRFVFMPWGIDATFYGQNPFGGNHASVYATGILARRLYLFPESRDRYLERLRDLLDAVWDEDGIVEQIDRMEEIITPVADPDGAVGVAGAVQGVRDFVRAQRGRILGEIDGRDPPEWTEPLRDPPCFVNIGTASGTFATTFGTVGAEDPFAAGSGTFDAEVDGEALGVVAVASESGWDPNNPGLPVVLVIGALDDGTVAIGYFPVTDPATFVAGARFSLGLGGSWAALVSLEPATGEMSQIGLLLNGELALDEGAIEDGAVVSGSFTADIIRFPWL